MSETTWHKFISNVKDYREVIGLTATLLSVATAIIIFIVGYRLTPLIQDLNILKMDAQANYDAHVDFVTNEEITLITTRLDKMSDRLDLLINKLIPGTTYTNSTTTTTNSNSLKQ